MTRYLKWDGHTHTHFCHHGDGSPLEQYIDRAIATGFECYSVTEHPQLPSHWLADAGVMKTLAMRPEEEDAYFSCVRACKLAYSDRIQLKIGLELDYLQGFVQFTEAVVDRHLDELEDAIVSVHFLPGKGGMRCIDLSSEDVRDGLLSYYGSMTSILEAYYSNVEEAIRFAGTLPFSTRIGHINLIQKFRVELPEFDDSVIERSLRRILPLLKRHKVGVDANTAGLRQASCELPYVPGWFIHECVRQDIEVVYGSDCHGPRHVSAGWEWFSEQVGHGSTTEEGEIAGASSGSVAHDC